MHRAPGFIGILIFVVFLLLIDFYVFSGVKAITSGYSSRTKKIVQWTFWSINAGLYLWMFALVLFTSFSKGFPRSFMMFVGAWVLFFIPKLVFSLFLLGEDVYRLLRGFYSLGHNVLTKNDPMEFGSSRRKFISTVAAATAAIPFAGIIHGLTAGKFRFRVRREEVFFPDLPDAFDGFTITQLSDIHIGSFDPDSDRDEVRRGIAMANAEKSDLFVFTGDLVNNMASEMDPWMNEVKQLRAPYGQYSILGNHDYGMYLTWPEQERLKSFNRLCEIHGELGFRLLRNEHTVIEKDGQQLYLLGVEDWGRGFLHEGDLDKALEGVPENAFKILLSHDPSHFDEIVSQHPTHVHMTLSGHTHGAQFGVEIPGVKWSPVQFAYPHWAGLYNEAKRYIYVNRGFGFLAFPGRVGIWPEVTVLTLRKGNSAPVST
ncbi:MAG TPA: metallophosphoesterase [Bacteroidia bacterium]|nr:metallophosphoesterase [Bacteroidia bacterium]